MIMNFQDRYGTVRKRREIFEVTREQLKRWEAERPGNFCYCLDEGCDLMLVSVGIGLFGRWWVFACSDQDEVADAERFENRVADRVREGDLSELEFEVWRVTDQPVVNQGADDDKDPIGRITDAADQLEMIVLGQIGEWDLDGMLKRWRDHADSRLEDDNRDELLSIASTLRSAAAAMKRR